MSVDLDSLAKLGNDWDPEGAAPPSAETLARARVFADLLERAGFPATDATPSVEEGIAFNFHSGKKYAAVEFLNEGSIGLFILPREADTVVECIEMSDLRATIGRIAEFMGSEDSEVA